MNQTQERIMKITGRQPNECSCSHCRSQCHTPCLGTPEDIIKIIEAGYNDKLKATLWLVGMKMNILPVPVPMIQPLQLESGCVFFCNGLCQLHDLGLKPTEGRLSGHTVWLDNFIPHMSLSYNVAIEWLKKENLPGIIKTFFLHETVRWPWLCLIYLHPCNDYLVCCRGYYFKPFNST